jgi:hypothetical protein
VVQVATRKSQIAAEAQGFDQLLRLGKGDVVIGGAAAFAPDPLQAPIAPVLETTPTKCPSRAATPRRKRKRDVLDSDEDGTPEKRRAPPGDRTDYVKAAVKDELNSAS